MEFNMSILRSLLVSLLALPLISVSAEGLAESDRLQEYAARNYTWPITDFIRPPTEGWKRTTTRRMRQVERIKADDDRYNGWVAVMAAAVATPNFTEHGWGLARAPPDLMEKLVASLHEGMPDAPEEVFINVITGEGDERPLFVRQPALNRKALNMLKPMHEEWSGVKLTGAIACK